MQTRHQAVVATLFSLKGRIKRSTFWAWSLPISAINALAWLVDSLNGRSFGALQYVVALLLLWPHLALNIKRCHDRNHPGPFALLGFIPLINIWYLIDIGFLRGTRGENRYGPESVPVPAHEESGVSRKSSVELAAFLSGTLKVVCALVIVGSLFWVFWTYRQNAEDSKYQKQQETETKRNQLLSIPKHWPDLTSQHSGLRITTYSLRTKWKDYNTLCYQFTVDNPEPAVYEAAQTARNESQYSYSGKTEGGKFNVYFYGSDGFRLLELPVYLKDMRSLIGSRGEATGLEAEGEFKYVEPADYGKFASWSIGWQY